MPSAAGSGWNCCDCKGGHCCSVAYELCGLQVVLPQQLQLQPVMLTLINFVMDLIRLRDSSDSRIMPSMPLYSSSET